MSAVFQCDLCRTVDRFMSTEREFCDGCKVKILQIKAKEYGKAHAELEKEFSLIVINQRKVLILMNHMRDRQINNFESVFGSVALNMLDNALYEEPTSETDDSDSQ